MSFDQALIILGFFAFCGGLIDAAVGGGGLVQIPALLHALPQQSLATVFGTNKLAVLAGNLSSIFVFKKNKIVWRLMLPPCFPHFYLHSLAPPQSLLCQKLMELVVFFILIAMAIYTFTENLGLFSHNIHHGKKEIILGVFFGGLIGFYDGAFGPGSGSLLLFVFVGFGFDF